jgi:spore coat protein H
MFFPAPTMGATNEPCGATPEIGATTHLPAFPQENELVTVSTTITGTGAITATLWYSAGPEFVAVPMTALAGGRYQATIPGQPDDTWVQYYVTAQGAAGQTATDPLGAPGKSYAYVAGFAPPSLMLNELMADNVATLVDPGEPGQYPDWLELHNAGSEPLDLGGFFLTDDPADPTRYPIPPGTIIPAGGFLLFYADGEPDQGPLHTSFSLSADGEMLGLYAAGGRVRIDAVTFPAQQPDMSFGRQQDGTGGWGFRLWPTPGMSNRSGSSMWLPLLRSASALSQVPLRLDAAGSAQYVAADGTVYEPDHPWTVGAPYGYLGGYEDLPLDWWDGYELGHTKDQMLYKTQRLNWQEYRVSQIPNGDYLLTLHFAEQVVHGPGLSVFDLVVEGQTVADDLDAYALAGRYYALDRRFAIAVADSELNIQAVAVAGEPHLSALELVPRPRDTITPAVPLSLTVTPSYNALLLDWADNVEDDLAGYHVYRATQPEGPYTRLTASEPVYSSRLQDRIGVAHVPYFYRVSAVDVYGNESGQSSDASAAAVGVADTALPLFQLEVSPANLTLLAANPTQDTEAPATFTWQGDTLDVKVRFRGGLSRTFDKKSWKVIFPLDNSPFAHHDRINLNANWLDDSLIRTKLANDLFTAAGLNPPDAEHVLLTLNGEFQGVYVRNEQVDEGFLLRSGRNPDASIYKVVWGLLELLPNGAAYRNSYEKETNKELGYKDLVQFIELINRTPDEAFAEQITQVLDVEAFLAYYAVDVLIGNIDSIIHNFYLVHDLESDLWELIPWDLDATFSEVDAAIDIGSKDVLRRRMLAVPAFRATYCQNLTEYMDTIFADEVMYPKVDALYAQIALDVQRDWRKLGWESSASFTAARDQLKGFITARKAFLRSEMATFCPKFRLYLGAVAGQTGISGRSR